MLTTNRRCSVVIPTLGRQSLWFAVTSALAQEAVDVEVIVARSGNVDVVVPDDPRVVVCGPFDGGANGARNGGLAKVRYSTVALLDDDDVWDPRKLDLQLSAVDSSIDDSAHTLWICSCDVQRDFASSQTQVVGRNFSSVISDPAEYLFKRRKLIRQRPHLQTSSLVFPLALYDQVKFDSELIIHQDWAWLLAAKRAFPELLLVKVDLPLVVYGQTSNSVTSNSNFLDSLSWADVHLRDSSRIVAGDFACVISSSFARKAHDTTGVRSCFSWARRNAAPSRRAQLFCFGLLARSAGSQLMDRIRARRRRIQ